MACGRRALIRASRAMANLIRFLGMMPLLAVPDELFVGPPGYIAKYVKIPSYFKFPGDIGRPYTRLHASASVLDESLFSVATTVNTP
jgi:hypothetical protein